MVSKKEFFQNFRLYAVTDLNQEDPDFMQKVEDAYRGGVDIIQLRSKRLSDEVLKRLGHEIRKIADRHEKFFIMNDRVDLAIETKADGVHVGQGDMAVSDVRELCRKENVDLIIGKSTHAIDQARQAEQEGVDYIGVGPIFETPTKLGKAAVGFEYIQQVKSQISIPFVCIGGINLTNLNEVLSAGAFRIAMVRAIFNAEDIYECTRSIRERIEQFNGYSYTS